LCLTQTAKSHSCVMYTAAVRKTVSETMYAPAKIGEINPPLPDEWAYTPAALLSAHYIIQYIYIWARR